MGAPCAGFGRGCECEDCTFPAPERTVPLSSFDQIVVQRDRLLCEVEDLLDAMHSLGHGKQALAILERHRDRIA